VNGLGGALGRAGAAGQALVRIDLEMQIAHGDSFGGALSRAGTTGQAIIGNNKSHGETSVSIWPIRAFVRCIVTHKSQKIKWKLARANKYWVILAIIRAGGQEFRAGFCAPDKGIIVTGGL
jgi:hypothetical protein